MKRTLTLLLAVTLLAALPVAAAQADAPVRSTTSHDLVFPPVFDGDYMLAWQGTISGDIEGTIEWWIDTTTWTAMLRPDSPAQASHYSMKTVIKDGEGALLIETLEKGTTTMANQTWRANGVVTKAYGDYAHLAGRQVHERGEFRTDVFPWKGDSTFRIN